MNSLPSTAPSLSHPKPDAATILFFDHTASMGGGEVALFSLVQRLDRTRFSPLVVLGSEGALHGKLIEAGVETYVLPIASAVAQTRKDSLGGGSLLRVRAIGISIAYAWQLARFMRSHRAALVHANSLKADIIGGLAAHLARVPIIWHVRDRIEPDYLPGPVVKVFRTLCRWLPRHVIANSHATLQTLHLPPTRAASVVYSGLDLNGYCPLPQSDGETPREEASRRLSQAPVIGIIGRISPWKGQHIFLKMAAAVHARVPDSRFQICGSAMFGEEAYEAELRALVTQLGLEECVDFLGFRSDVAHVIQGLDLLVHASTTGEPFGQVVVQGMAAGKPVVATRGGGVPEIVVDGVTGRLVPMNDVESMTQAVLDLLADPKAALAMGLAGCQRAQEQFSIEHTVEQVETIYTNMLARRGQRLVSPASTSDTRERPANKSTGNQRP